jgi:gluconate kinase
MILFLIGQWGAGKSHVARQVERISGLYHLDADTLFTQDLVDAVKECTIHPDQMAGYYDRVIAEMQRTQRQHRNFMVTQGIYTDPYRRLIYRAFVPEIHFVLVKTPDPILQKERIRQRAQRTGNPVSVAAYEHMARYWEPVSIPHSVLWNDGLLDDQIVHLLHRLNLFSPTTVTENEEM